MQTRRATAHVAVLATSLVLGLVPAVASAGDADLAPRTTAPVSAKEPGPEPDVPEARRRLGGGRTDAGHDGRSWIVVLDDVTSAAQARSTRDAAAAAGGRVGRSFSRLVRGFEVELPEAAARALASRPDVRRVEPNLPVSSTTPVGLDRLDQRDLPLDGGAYAPPSDTATTTVYVVDTAVRATHTELTGRTTAGYSSIEGDATAPCTGDHHGTHVAGTAAGTTTGVAPAATVVPVRVLDCSGSGTTVSVVDGLEWVAANAQLPAVVNMSLGGGGSAVLDAAVQALIDAGIPVVVAAGNEADDACRYSPARVPDAITVAASRSNDARASYSNFGPCVDLFATGSGIRSAGGGDDTEYLTMSGTSMAAPHVAGVVALHLAATPAATPAEVTEHLLSTATNNRLTGLLAGDPNLLASSLQDVEANPPAAVPAAELVGCDTEQVTESGALAGPSDEVLLPREYDVVTDVLTRHRGCLTGPAGTDFDLELWTFDHGAGRYVLSAESSGSTSQELLVVDLPPGRHFWRVLAYGGAGEFRLGHGTTARESVSPACSLESRKTGRFDHPGDTVAVSAGVSLDAGDRVRACLRGPTGTDFDLKLQRYDTATGTWKTRTTSTASTSSEEISVEVPAGRYRWVAHSFAGEGRYALASMATPPTALSAGPSGTTSDTSATFKFSSRDGGARFQCRLDSGSWRNCTSPHSLSNLGGGTHTMRVRAVDAAGNVDPSPAVRTWSVKVASGAQQFTDVDSSNPFSDAIGRLADAEVTKGCNPPTNDRFCPGDPVTRQQMAAFLARAIPLGSAPHAGFTDVPSSSPFSGAVASLADAGITRGCNPPRNDQFCPGEPVTRQQMAAFLTRALRLPAGNATFRDVPASSPFSDAVAALADAGITRGCNPPRNDQFCPGEPVTRQQMAAFLQRSGVLD